MKLSDYLLEEIRGLSKTDKVFGYIGGMVAHIIDSAYTSPKIELVNMITEQGAGFAAEGYARISGKLGVAVATSGPGATNLVTPIANCFFDSTPVLFITGQVNTYEYRKYDIKQCGFQETNIVDIVKPITKYSTLITDPKSIKYELQKAIHIAMSGRKGPVLLDIPMDIQRAEIDINSLEEYCPPNESSPFDFDVTLLKKYKRPLILAGNGVNLANAKDELSKFISNTNIPIVQSLAGVDSVDFKYEYNLGLIGTYGNRYGNIALYESDLLIVLGSRLDIRQTGANIDFMKNKTIVHVDIDEKELNCTKFKKTAIKADIKEFITYLNSKEIELNITDWQKRCLKLKKEFSNQNKIYKLPNEIIESIFESIDDTDNFIITADVGQNQLWTAQSLKIKQNQRFISSCGHGCMGFSLPAAIGASFCNKKVLAFSGDGGFQMNIQELEILKRRNLPIKVIVLNNKNLGMVRTFQELYFDGRLASTVEDYSAPDFSKIAQAYGIKSITINAQEFNIKNIESLLKSSEPVLINIIFELKTEVEPRVLFGNSINNPEPRISNCEVE